MILPSSDWFARTFSALRHRNYRLLWLGSLISNAGDWMDLIALNWLVVAQGGGAWHLALVNLARALPIILFTLVGGAVADRVERRRMLMVTQSCAMMLAFMLAAMVLSGHAPIWAVLLLAMGRGVVLSFNLPARHALVSEVVPPADLPNAVALNSMTINTAKILGPAIAGVLIAAYGSGICFLLNGLSFIVVLWTLAAMQFPRRKPRTKPAEGLVASIGVGLAYARADRTILLLLLASLVPTFLGQPYLALLTLFAHDVFDIGPGGLGILTSCAAAGSIGGAMILATRPRWAASPRAMLVFVLLFGAALVAFALSPVAAVAIPVLFLVGAMHIAGNASNNTILQLRVADHMRGRVLSIMLLNRGLAQLGTAVFATLAGFLGVRAAEAGAGLAIVVLAGAMFAFSRLGRRGA